MAEKKEYIVLYDNGCGDPGEAFDTKEQALEFIKELIIEYELSMDKIWLYEGVFIGQPEATEEDDTRYIKGSLKGKDKEGEEFIVFCKDEGDAGSFDTFEQVVAFIEDDLLYEEWDHNIFVYQGKFIGSPEIIV